MERIWVRGSDWNRKSNRCGAWLLLWVSHSFPYFEILVCSIIPFSSAVLYDDNTLAFVCTCLSFRNWFYVYFYHEAYGNMPVMSLTFDLWFCIKACAGDRTPGSFLAGNSVSCTEIIGIPLKLFLLFLKILSI